MQADSGLPPPAPVAPARRSRAERARRRVRWLTPLHTFVGLTQLASVVAAALLFEPLSDRFAAGDETLVLGGLLGTGGALTLLRVGLAIALLRAARHLPPGVGGRLRRQGRALASLGTALFLSLVVVFDVVALVTAAERGFLFGGGLAEAVRALPETQRTAFAIAAIPGGVFVAADLVLLVSEWFLLPGRFRRAFWVLADLALVAASVWAFMSLPFVPKDGDALELRQATLRLGLHAFLAWRLVTRLLPPFLGGLEGLGFRPLVAARHLRARKSGFLAAIGGLSIGAVMVSTCMLVVVLSVMGGFRNDLKEKILGAHAHVVVERQERGTFEGWLPVLDAVRGTERVVAATPFVRGEVMVTSASNRAGAVLQGIDPESVREVTELERYLSDEVGGRGSLDNLSEPERLLRLDPGRGRSILDLGGPEPADDADEDDEGPAKDEPRVARDMDELERLLGEDLFDPVTGLPPGAGGEPGALGELPPGRLLGTEAPTTPPPEDVLPGVIVGRELARTLRLFVGDELEVVSPLGALGPTGPIPKVRRFRVAGIFYSGMYEFDMKLAYVLLEEGQRFLGTGQAITGVEVKVDDVERAPAIADDLRAGLATAGRDELQVKDWQELNRNLFGALALEKLAMFVALGIAILIAGFCVFATLTLMVQEKSREVGILKAMGTTPRDVVRIFLTEGLLIGALGAMLGLGLGYVLTFATERFGIRMDPEVYYIDRLPVTVDPTEFAVVGVSAVLVCLLATVFPAVLASRLRPVDALRYQ
ncbi:MAG: ABC transporter permease [Myxococcota bacterium]